VAAIWAAGLEVISSLWIQRRGVAISAGLEVALSAGLGVALAATSAVFLEVDSVTPPGNQY
jgi:hypothetical protein